MMYSGSILLCCVPSYDNKLQNKNLGQFTEYLSSLEMPGQGKSRLVTFPVSGNTIFISDFLYTEVIC